MRATPAPRRRSTALRRFVAPPRPSARCLGRWLVALAVGASAACGSEAADAEGEGEAARQENRLARPAASDANHGWPTEPFGEPFHAEEVPTTTPTGRPFGQHDADIPPIDGLVRDNGRIVLADLPAHSVAFNPAIVPYGKGALLAIRLDTYGVPPTGMAMQIVLAVLDANFVQVGPTATLDLRDANVAQHTTEDPRLVWHNGQLLVQYNGLQPAGDGMVRSQHLAEVALRPRVGARAGQSVDAADPTVTNDVLAGGAEFVLRRRAALRVPADMQVRPVEKNWAPFSHDGALHFVYNVNPHVIFRLPDDAWSDGATITVDHVTHRADPNRPTQATGKAPVGEWIDEDMRGGTGAAFNPNLGAYEAFFHTRTFLQLSRRPLRHWVTLGIGYYAFDPNAPFAVRAVLPQGVPVPDVDASASPYLHCAYPGGFLLRDGVYYVAYGLNDSALGLLALDAEVLQAHARATQGTGFAPVDAHGAATPKDTPAADVTQADVEVAEATVAGAAAAPPETTPASFAQP